MIYIVLLYNFNYSSEKTETKKEQDKIEISKENISTEDTIDLSNLNISGIQRQNTGNGLNDSTTLNLFDDIDSFDILYESKSQQMIRELGQVKNNMKINEARKNFPIKTNISEYLSSQEIMKKKVDLTTKKIIQATQHTMREDIESNIKEDQSSHNSINHHLDLISSKLIDTIHTTTQEVLNESEQETQLIQKDLFNYQNDTNIQLDINKEDILTLNQNQHILQSNFNQLVNDVQSVVNQSDTDLQSISGMIDKNQEEISTLNHNQCILQGDLQHFTDKMEYTNNELFSSISQIKETLNKKKYNKHLFTLQQNNYILKNNIKILNYNITKRINNESITQNNNIKRLSGLVNIFITIFSFTQSMCYMVVILSMLIIYNIITYKIIILSFFYNKNKALKYSLNKNQEDIINDSNTKSLFPILYKYKIKDIFSLLVIILPQKVFCMFMIYILNILQ